MSRIFALCVGGPWNGRVVECVRSRTLIVSYARRTGIQDVAYVLSEYQSASETSVMRWRIYRCGDAEPSEARLAVFKGRELLDGS
jgi:hypothetical protein